jgi:hypothetical protein
VGSREERLAENEILFRHVNERIIELTDRWSGHLDLVCECADVHCAARLPISVGEYREVRADPHQFAVVPGHEILDVEDVVDRRDRYLVVAKPAATHARTAESDPRG